MVFVDNLFSTTACGKCKYAAVRISDSEMAAMFADSAH